MSNPQRIANRFELGALIGQGGMGEVYRGLDTRTGQPVAIKALRPELVTGNPDMVERFTREGEALRKLDHPNIVKVLANVVEDDRHYLVMEYVGGGSLRELLDKERQLPSSRVLEIALELADALTRAHHLGIIHRDLKPANVLLAEDGTPRLTDFGVAHLADRTRLTQTGMLIGTLAYLSPEACSGERLDARADIWAFGVMLYEMLAGRRPFAETQAGALLVAILTQLPPDLAQFCPDVPAPLASLISRMLERDREQRVPGVRQIGADLEAILRGTPLPHPAPPTPPIGVTDRPSIPGTDVTAPIISRDISPPPVPLAPPSRVETLAPPEPNRPPEVAGFVGRTAELAHYARELQENHLAVISGMAGVGKTALAAMLARQVAAPERIFWHVFHEGEGVDAIIWQLAAFLARRGQPSLWEMLQSAQQTGGQPPPPELLFDYLFQMLRGAGYLLCFDDFHFVEDDPLLAKLLHRLQESVGAGDLSLIITSRRVPAFLQTASIPPLTGINVEDTDELLVNRGLALPTQLTDTLHRHTEGNAQLLNLTISALQRGGQPTTLIGHLAETEDIERYLMKRVDRGLTEAERGVMNAVAVLLGYPGPRDVVEVMLEDSIGRREIRRALSDLSRRYLLDVSESEAARAYSQHAIVQTFYYDLLSRSELRVLHRQAGEYYEAEAPDALKAARHFQRAGDQARAARLATADVRTIINRGQARGLRRLLERFSARQLDPEPWATINIARGEVHTLLGESRLAQTAYQEALAQLAPLSDTPAVRELRARTCRGMGKLLQHGSPQEALVWLRRGLEELDGASDMEEAALHIKLGTVQIAMGNYEAALRPLERGLALLPEGPGQLRSSALINLGTIYYARGDTERANENTQHGLEISRKLHDDFQLVRVLGNLGIEKFIAGDWAGAVADYQEALSLVERLGSVTQQVQLELNLGVMYTKQGDDDSALASLSSCLQLAQRGNLRELELVGLCSLADLHLRRGEPDAAAPLLAEAEPMAREMMMKAQLPEIHRLLTLAQLARGEPQAALDHAEESVSLARELGDGYEEGMSLRVLGQAQLAGERPEAALAAFEHSLALLADDPYEAARTRAEWGRHLTTAGSDDAERGSTLLQEARTTFKTLGARRDLAAV